MSGVSVLSSIYVINHKKDQVLLHVFWSDVLHFTELFWYSFLCENMWNDISTILKQILNKCNTVKFCETYL
jgi:hypothetical protein